MQQKRILVVDDEEDILKLVSYNLQKEGYQIIQATTGEEALQSAQNELPDLVVLDLMLPGMRGLEVCKILKSHPDTRQIPILILTARDAESDVIVGLELGADDYITKPFSPRILVARAKAVLRRSASSTPDDVESPIQVAGIMIHPDRHEVFIENQPVDLTATEFRILNYIARRPGRVYTRDQIVDAARGKDYPVTDRSVDVHIVSLRKKLGHLGRHIETVRGVGYRFKE